ncbi:sugar phosphate isomerase/epimerase family protein [Cohnella cellulosilytica]|uniref:Sugar phosphate isomerase/epimerase family protein n=1 Tax=Cohnella cellulosilytica TaxID=986710 RepID=A0ABW2F9D6_9BACL
MNDYRDYSISTFSLIGLPLKDALLELVEKGWRSIELMCEDRHRELLFWSNRELGLLKELGESHGIEWTLHAPIHGLNPGALAVREIEESKRLLLRAADIASRLDCRYVVLHCGLLPPESDDADSELREREALRRCIAFLREILARTERQGIRFALENVPPYPDTLGSKVDFILEITEAVGDPRLRIVFDVAHAHLLGEGRCVGELQKVLPQLVGLHINDNPGDSDSHLAVGDGSIPFPTVVKLVEDSGLPVNWTLETCRPDYADQSAARLRSLRGMLG